VKVAQHIQLQTLDKHKIRAVSGRTALVLWFIHHCKSIGNPRKDYFLVDDPEMFIVQIGSAIERTFGWTYKPQPRSSFEKQCLLLLELLYQSGNIIKLKVNYANLGVES